MGHFSVITSPFGGSLLLYQNQVELLSGVSTPAQLRRRHGISSGLLYYWKKQYGQDDLTGNGKRQAALKERIRQLEQMLGKAYLENEFLKRAL